jgi:apolipoprotein N-acyltransferase
VSAQGSFSSSGARRVPILGGLISALLLSFGLPGAAGRLLPWFALVPFFFSLHRHRETALGRWLHGLSFGWLVALHQLTPFFRPFLEEASRGGQAGGGALALAGLQVGALWMLWALQWGLFAGASGLLLRQRSLWPALAGLPLLWAGLEALPPEAWLFPSLGGALEPSAPESQAASLAGVAGLSAAMVFASTAFLLSIVERGWGRQVLFAAAGCGAFLLCHLHGTVSSARDLEPVTVRVGLVQAESGDIDELLLQARTLISRHPPELLVFPEEAFRRRLSEAAALLEELAREHDLVVIAGAAQDESAAAGAGAILSFDPRGAPAARFESRRRCCSLESATAAGPILLETALAAIGAGAWGDYDSPAYARRQVQSGAQLLVGLGREPRSWGGELALLRARTQAWRAVENRRWLVRAAQGGGTCVFDPYGRLKLVAPPGLGWAGTTTAGLRTELSFFTRLGWTFRPLAQAAAAGLVIVSLLAAFLERRRRRGK